ncbi:hypothetical protein CCR75_007703 [Bremia lactucae]|uniref:WRKY19-like zinc finger domain-containing protein n=1 Tax=Bremia lactucae TaxID=4779 RepID=A0A976IEU5_BRELC|nr:hypothetical protein CCR75_007703 [Bremia lactucae]
MNIYPNEVSNAYRSSHMTCGAIPTRTELSALLNLVIPTSEDMLPVETTSRQSSALSFTQQATFDCAFEFRELVDLQVTNNTPTIEPISNWIAPMPSLCQGGSELPLLPFPQTQDPLAFLRAHELTISCPQTKLKKLGNCQVAGCHTKKQKNGRCIRHGGGRRCTVSGCTRGAQSMGRCKRHGGGARCTMDGCNTSSQGGGLCRTHGGGKLCTAPGCKKGAQRQGKCATHASQKCRMDDCLRVARFKGVCSHHKTEVFGSAK